MNNKLNRRRKKRKAVINTKVNDFEENIFGSNMPVILNSLSDGVFITDQNYNLKFVNSVFTEIWGDYKNKKCYQYFYYNNKKCCKWCTLNSISNKVNNRGEFCFKYPDKTYDIIMTPLKASDEKIYNLVIHRNITKNKLRKQLIQSDKSPDIRQLSEWISHKFNNILGIIKLRTQFLKVNLDNTNKVMETLDTIESLVDQGSGIINDINDFTNPMPLELQNVNISKVIDSIIEIVESFLKTKNISIISDYLESTNILIDIDKMYRVFLNLILNSCHALKNRRKKEIYISVKQDKNNVIIKFSDTGISMDIETSNNIFRPSFSEKKISFNNRQDTGLNLSIISSIIKQHKGSIEVERIKNRGTSFFIKLPVNKLK